MKLTVSIKKKFNVQESGYMKWTQIALWKPAEILLYMSYYHFSNIDYKDALVKFELSQVDKWLVCLSHQGGKRTHTQKSGLVNVYYEHHFSCDSEKTDMTEDTSIN